MFREGSEEGFPVGRFLLALRKPGTSIGESWEFPGGKARPWEFPRQALRREFMEEFRIPVSVGRRILESSFYNGSKRYLLRAYLVDIHSDDFQLSEHQEVRWVTTDECLDLPMAESDALILMQLQQLREQVRR